MSRLPDAMLRYMTWELEELLGQLSPPQIRAISRIIACGHLADEPLAPYSLFTGDDAICGRSTWVKRGKLNEATGEWRGVGWSHQPTFVEALQLAKRLARQVEIDESLGAVRKAVQRARLASPNVVEQLVGIATGERIVREADGTFRTVAVESAHRDQIAASKVVLDVALADANNDSASEREDAAADWWRAANEE